MSNRTTIKQTTIGGSLKTFLLQFIYNEGNGWAIINAATVNQAKSVFEVQTQYKGAQVTDIKETRYFGDNMQLVFEGAVTTMYNSGGNIIVSKKEYETFMRLVGAELSKYYTRDEIDDILKNVPIDVDLSNYYTKSEVNYRISTIPKGEQGEQGPPGPTGPRGLQGEPGTPGTPGRNGTDGHDGVDGLTPYIGPDNNWWIGETNTRIKAVGEDGKFADLTPEEKESLRGADGVSITNFTASYAANNNNSSAPTSGWNTRAILPTSTAQYVWMKITVTLSNNTTKNTNPIIVSTYTTGDSVTPEVDLDEIYDRLDGIDTDLDNIRNTIAVLTPTAGSAVVGMGSYADAYNTAKAYDYENGDWKPDSVTVFGWILVATDNGETIKKIIWHTGQGTFIDALGATILGPGTGLTITP